MKPTINLFNLIHSLTKNEKGYFKKFASLHVQKGQNNYMKLFDAINEQREYDEVKIKKYFSANTFSKNLPYEKNYLHNIILTSLCQYHADKNVDFTLRQLLNQLDILFSKGLHTSCDKVLKKAKKIAVENENFLFLSEIGEWERKIIYAKGIIHSEEGLESICNKTIHALELKKNFLEYLKVYDAFLYCSRKYGGIRDETEHALFKKFIEHPLIKNENSALTVSAKLSLYNILAGYYYMTADFGTSSLYFKKLLEAYGAISVKKRNANVHALYMINYMTACAYSKKYSECERIIQAIKNLHVNSPRDMVRISYMAISQEIVLYTIRGDFDKAQSIMEKIIPNIEKDKYLINPEVYEVIIANQSEILFGLGRYKEALQNLNKSLFNKDTMCNFREEIRSYLQLFYLFIHIELGNSELIEYALKSTSRYLRKKKRLYKFEIAILDFIKNKLVKTYTEQDLIEAFILLRDEMIQISKDPYEKFAFLNFDIISWLESKIENRPFAEIVRQKANLPYGG